MLNKCIRLKLSFLIFFICSLFSLFSQTQPDKSQISNNSYRIPDNLWITYLHKTAILLEKANVQSFMNYVIISSDGNLNDMLYFKRYVSHEWKKDYEELTYRIGTGKILTEIDVKIYLSSLQPIYKEYFENFQKKKR